MKNKKQQQQKQEQQQHCTQNAAFCNVNRSFSKRLNSTLFAVQQKTTRKNKQNISSVSGETREGFSFSPFQYFCKEFHPAVQKFYSFVVTFLIPCFQALDVAHSTMARDYIECCAKTRWNVKEVFKSAADAILFKNDDKVDEIKSQSVLKKFSWFSRRSSGSDIADCNTIPRSPSANRRLSLFSTS